MEADMMFLVNAIYRLFLLGRIEMLVIIFSKRYYFYKRKVQI